MFHNAFPEAPQHTRQTLGTNLSEKPRYAGEASPCSGLSACLYLPVASLAPPFAQVVPYGGDAELVALLDELSVDPGPGDALLRLPRHSSGSSSILGATVSMTGEGFGRLAILSGSGTVRYLLTVLRLRPISLATERMLC